MINYRQILEDSAYRFCDIEREFGIPTSQMCGYIYRGVEPKKNKQKIEEIMSKISKQPKLVKHPSYGYATEDEIEKLKTLGICPERSMIIARIDKRAKSKGKGV